MFESYYKLEISGKDVKRFIRTLYKMNICFEEIDFSNKVCYVKVDSKNYEKIMNIKTSYSIKTINLYGLKKWGYIIKKNLIFLLFSSLGILLLYFLSNIIFDIEIIHSDTNIRNILSTELDKYGIKKYHFVK